METTVKKASAHSVNAKANGAVNKVENRPNLTGKEAKKDGKIEDQLPAQTSQGEANKAESKAGNSLAVGNQPANGQQQLTKPEVKDVPNTDGQKTEPKAEIKYIKPALNLEQTLKSVEGLHRLSIQRITLLSRIKLLEDFEVKLIEENDELENNPYQGCKLIIKDDKGREFVTNTPNLIRMVSQFIFDACHDKLAEIEANIIFPNA